MSSCIRRSLFTDGAGGANVGEELILAKDLMKEVLRHHIEVIEEFTGSDLVGRSYEPLFEGAVNQEASRQRTVLSADWVTTTDGTGVVHTAVMYGEDDYNLGMGRLTCSTHSGYGWPICYSTSTP